MNNNLIGQIGKYLFAIPMLIFGLFHFMAGDKMSGAVPQYIPGGVIWVYFTGLALVAAAVSIFIGKMTRLACLLLALMLIIFIVTIHLPGVSNAADEMSKQMAIVGLLKDVAMAGGALILASKYPE